MLKNILSSLIILATPNAYSNVYEVVISDKVTGEVITEICSNEEELTEINNFIIGLDDSSVKLSVKKLKIPTEITPLKAGGEGSGD